jgi:hypothetical protein
VHALEARQINQNATIHSAVARHTVAPAPHSERKALLACVVDGVDDVRGTPRPHDERRTPVDRTVVHGSGHVEARVVRSD